jgi:hypothetical protein
MAQILSVQAVSVGDNLGTGRVYPDEVCSRLCDAATPMEPDLVADVFYRDSQVPFVNVAVVVQFASLRLHGTFHFQLPNVLPVIRSCAGSPRLLLAEWFML